MSDLVDSRFVFHKPTKWNQGQFQKFQGSEVLHILPSNKSPTLYEFELPNTNSALIFGPKTGFRVRCALQCKAAATETDDKFNTIPLEDYAKLIIEPNWFDQVVKSVDVFNNNSIVKCDDVPRYADAYVNTYLHAHMDSDLKAYLTPEPWHPSNAVPIKGKWNMDENGEWHEYSKLVLNKSLFGFRYVPLTFPFFQNANFGKDGHPPCVLPLTPQSRMTISVNLKEDLNCIFRKPTSNTKVYRLKIESIELYVEEARLLPSFERTFFKRKDPLVYAGVTRYGMVENIPPENMTHRTELPKSPMPEGIFIFALPKKVLGGEYKYQEVASLDDPIFVKHNIESIEVTCNGLPLAVKTPKPGMFRHPQMEIQNFIDHKDSPPFGLYQDPKMLTLDRIREGGDNSLFPHVYYTLCPTGKQTRTIAIGDDGRALNQPVNLELTFKFKANGAVANVQYFIYAFYTDVNMIYDMKTNTFIPNYMKSRPSV